MQPEEVTTTAAFGPSAAELAERMAEGAAAVAAWIAAGYWRIEGELWCCPRCYAATPKPTEHDEWHKTLRASTGPMGFLSGGRL